MEILQLLEAQVLVQVALVVPVEMAETLELLVFNLEQAVVY